MTLRSLRQRLVRKALSSSGYFATQHRLWERRVSADPKHLDPHPDGRPMPPPYLLTLVAGSPSERWFSQHGRRHAELITRLAGEEGVTLMSGVRLLDYGCGCGRIARWLAPDVEAGGGAFTGVDIRRDLIGWCAENLPGDYRVGRLRRPIPAADATVDMLYAVSVITHLKRASAEALMAEFARVLAPGGVALVTFQDEGFNVGDRAAELLKQGYIVSSDRAEGSNHMSAWVTHAAVRALSGARLQVVRTLPSEGGDQAVCVLRKPA